MNIFTAGKKRKSEVLIFAFPRTGSTTLAEALGMFWRVKIMLEPFNKADGYSGSREDIADRDSLCRVMDEISGKGINVVKHLNCQLSQELNCRLLEYGFRQILFLWRRNSLKRAVSNEISFQAREWRRDREKILNAEYKSLDINKLRENMEWYRSEVKWYRAFLESRGIPFSEIVMEDFYLRSIAEKEKAILSLARRYFFLRSFSCNQKRLREILSPEVSRLNSRETYEMIPNIGEVDRELSSKENGFLFED
ncbi:MAG: hypothetical protein ABIJ42_11010 [Acidobacteriota bacterium]